MRSIYKFILILLLSSPSVCLAQYDRPPNKGGYTKSLGLPESLKFHAGFQTGTYRGSDQSILLAEANFGVYRDLMSPVVGALGWSLEAYLANRNKVADGGGRAMIEMPVLYLAGGVDYNARDNAWDFILSLKLPLKRGGIFNRGTSVRINWLPSRGHTASVGIKVPLWQPSKGRTRSRHGHVDLNIPDTIPVDYRLSDANLQSSLVNIQHGMAWLRQMTVPFFDQNGGNHEKAMASFQRDMISLDTHVNLIDDSFPDGHSFDAEIRAYHAELARAFSIAADNANVQQSQSTAIGELVATAAKEILLDEVIFPYNHLLGQEKREDTVKGFSMYARGAFARWLITNSPVSVANHQATQYVFDQILDFVEASRSASRELWGDSRLVWLPLHYGFLPEEHDSQDELDNILERASREKFTRGNEVWYVVNEAFQFELGRQIHAARDYHVLWIHDVQGFNANGDPDRISFAQMIDSYYAAMTDRINEYDDTGVFPTYMIFLDQHYFEGNKGRFWMKQLEEPLNEKINFSSDQQRMQTTLDSARTELWTAIRSSALLQSEIREYGEDWLENLVKVHVNITNPADLSFRSQQMVPLIRLPDNTIRDHRKISFYDVTEADPYKGAGILTGMGVGEHYVGSGWEDRGLLSRGPAALDLKNAARQLLYNQGFSEDEIPTVLRPLPFAADYEEKISAFIEQRQSRTDSEFRKFLDDYRSLQLHNETGFRPKKLTVARAVTYTLMPPGSVMKITDSLFNSPLWASMLFGSALRGARVMVIAPALENAPSSSFMTMSREYEMFARLIMAQNMFESEMKDAGGLLKTAVYNLQIDARDIAGRATILSERLKNEPFLRELYNFDPAVIALLDSVENYIPKQVLLQTAGNDASRIRPSLHLKAQYFASPAAWDKLTDQKEWTGMFEEYIRQFSKRFDAADEDYGNVTDFADAMTESWRALAAAYLPELTPKEVEELILYLHVGTANQDYRSMMLDGEVMVIVSGWNALHGIMDFIFLAGNSQWVDSEEELQIWLPPQSNFKRKIARWMAIML